MCNNIAIKNVTNESPTVTKSCHTANSTEEVGGYILFNIFESESACTGEISEGQGKRVDWTVSIHDEGINVYESKNKERTSGYPEKQGDRCFTVIRHSSCGICPCYTYIRQCNYLASTNM